MFRVSRFVSVVRALKTVSVQNRNVSDLRRENSGNVPHSEARSDITHRCVRFGRVVGSSEEVETNQR